jgi:hypothetical protein
MNSRVIVRRDIEQIYKGIWLEACCSFEQFIEQLFIGLLLGRFVHPSRYVFPRITFRSDIIARDVLSSGDRYVDWLPYDRTERIALAYYRNGLPFKSLTTSDKNTISKICHIRNAIAHKSEYSKRIFQRNVIGSLNLPPKDRYPAPYLRTIFRMSPSQTIYESYAIEMASIAIKLCQ